MATTEKPKNAVKGPEPRNSALLSGRWRTITLAAGDACVFLIFAAYGRYSHGEASGLAAVPQIVLTAAPIAAGWFIVAPFIGAYRRDIAADPRKMWRRTALAWVCSWPVSMLLRGIFVDHAIPPISFAIVTLVVNMVLLLLWRWPYALNNSMKNRG